MSSSASLAKSSLAANGASFGSNGPASLSDGFGFSASGSDKEAILGGLEMTSDGQFRNVAAGGLDGCLAAITEFFTSLCGGGRTASGAQFSVEEESKGT